MRCWKVSRRRLILLLILVLFFAFAAPIIPATEPAPNTCNSGVSCVVHYTESISCYLEGASPASVGTYYYDGEYGVMCGPLLV